MLQFSQNLFSCEYLVCIGCEKISRNKQDESARYAANATSSRHAVLTSDVVTYHGLSISLSHNFSSNLNCAVVWEISIRTARPRPPITHPCVFICAAGNKHILDISETLNATHQQSIILWIYHCKPLISYLVRVEIIKLCLRGKKYRKCV